MDLEAGVDDGGEMALLLQLAAELEGVTGDQAAGSGDFRRLRPVDLPQIAAGELDRPHISPSLGHHGLHGLSTPSEMPTPVHDRLPTSTCREESTPRNCRGAGGFEAIRQRD